MIFVVMKNCAILNHHRTLTQEDWTDFVSKKIQKKYVPKDPGIFQQLTQKLGSYFQGMGGWVCAS